MARWTPTRLLLALAYASRLIPTANSFSFPSRRRGITPSSLHRNRQREPVFFDEPGGRRPSENIASESRPRARRRRESPIAPLPASSQPAASSSSAAIAVLDFYAGLDALYDGSSAIKCPFFRRRAADLIDGAAMTARFLLIRHKSLPGISDLFLDAPSDADGVAASAFSAPGCKPLGRHIERHPDGTARKALRLPLPEIASRVRADWTGGIGGADKGYYITGRLDSTIYRDDCLFTGPDPDMPVRGLRKYLSAAAHLFDARESDAELLSAELHEDGGGRGCGMVEVTWRLGGVLKLPWHPTVEPWTGTTMYHLDEEGLIYLHEEGWDISVWRAFTCTLFPEARSWRIWDTEKITIPHV